MFRLLVLLIIIGVISLHAECQINISGQVFDKFDKFPIPGVNVLEKGTKNGTVTDTSGIFQINVSDPNSTLVLFFVGYELQEIAINKKDSLLISLKPHCLRDWFDHQKIGFFYCGGIFKTPIGGGLEFSYPAFYRETVLKNRFSFQTNGHGINFVNADASMEHLAVSCNFDADILLNYRGVNQNNSLSFNSFAIETNLNFGQSYLGYFRLIAGFTVLDLNHNENLKYSPIIGVGMPVGRPFQVMITGKVSLFNKTPQIEGSITRRFRKVDAFLRFYNYSTFTELTAGIGFDFTYRFKKQRQAYAN